MNEVVANGPWIVAQVLRVRQLEADVKNLLVANKAPGEVLNGLLAELKFQLTLLELAVN